MAGGGRGGCGGKGNISEDWRLDEGGGPVRRDKSLARRVRSRSRKDRSPARREKER